MIISRTPFRISFFGGGTDFPEWFRRNEGAVLTTTIDKYCYLTCRYLPPFFKHKYRIVYSKIENVKSVSEIKHPAVRATLEYMKIERGVEIHHDGDLPARSGIGSSSAFTVGLLNTLYALKGEMRSKIDLASEAIHIEQNILKENVGCQDQVEVAFGGVNKIVFNPDGTFEVHPIILPKEKRREFERYLLLCFTGVSRLSSEIAREQVRNISKKKKELKAMYQLVDKAVKVLSSKNGSISEFGKLLHESWLLKRSLSQKISSDFIDEIYSVGKRSGALGGKVLGAGGGGFVLFVAPPETHKNIRENLKDLLFVPFKLENQGSQIIVYQPE